MPQDPNPYGMQAKLIGDAIDRLKPLFDQRQLSAQIGFEKPNALSMIRHGQMAVPLARIPNLARVLEIDPGKLFRTVLRETFPELEELIYELFGGILTEREKMWVKIFEEVDLPLVPNDPAERKLLITCLNERGWRVY